MILEPLRKVHAGVSIDPILARRPEHAEVFASARKDGYLWSQFSRGPDTGTIHTLSRGSACHTQLRDGATLYSCAREMSPGTGGSYSRIRTETGTAASVGIANRQTSRSRNITVAAPAGVSPTSSMA